MPPQHHSHVRGILYLLGAASTFALLDASSKWLAQFYPVPMVVWARYLAHTVLMLLWLGPQMGLNLVRSHQTGMQIVRGMVLLGVSLVFLLSLSMMPIAEATAISFMSPLLLTMLSVVVLHEYVPRGAWMAVFTGFIGVVIIIRPGGEFFSPVVLLPLGSALLFATYQLLTRKMAGVDSTMTTLFYGTLVGTVLLSFFVPLFWVTPHSYLHGFVFLLAGAFSGAGHLFLIRAFEYTPASVLAPFMYWQLVVASGVGLLLFDTFPDGWSLVGMVIIVLSGVWVATHRRN